MDLKEIKDQLTSVEGDIRALGYSHASVSLRFNWIFSNAATVSVDYRVDDYSKLHTEFLHINSGTIQDAIDAARKFAGNLPPVAETKKQDFIQALGKLIDQGRDLGFEVEFMNPLVESMKKLSENIITKQPF